MSDDRRDGEEILHVNEVWEQLATRGEGLATCSRIVSGGDAVRYENEDCVRNQEITPSPTFPGA